MAVIPIPRSTPHGAKPKNPHAANLNFPRTAPPAVENAPDTSEPAEQQAVAAESELPMQAAPREAREIPSVQSDMPEAKGTPQQSPARKSLPVVTRAAEFRQAFLQKTWLLDGAMATMLFSKGVSTSASVDELNLTLPAVVRDVHREYLAAGAEIISTNTFGANRIRLSSVGAAANMTAINRAGVRIARQAATDAGSGAFVAGIIGPLGASLEPTGTLSPADAQQAFRDQAAALHGVDLFVLETFRDLVELRAAASGIREAAGSDVVLVAQVSVEADGTLGNGIPPEVWTHELDHLATELGIDAIGVNCSSGPFATVQAIRLLASVTSKPLAASPSAGLPSVIDGRLQYPSSVEYFAAQTGRFLQAGAKLVGGCCGTTPDYVRQMRAVVDGFDGVVTPEVPRPPATATPKKPASRLVLKDKSKLGAKLASGKFVTVIELGAPRSHEIGDFVAAAKQCKKASIDAISIPVGARAQGRMSAASALQLAQAGAGIETILYATARRKNARELEALLGDVNALGLHNVLCLTGEGPGGGSLDSIRGARIANSLNGGVDLGGNRFDPPSGLVIGVGVNLSSLDPSDDSSSEISSVERKRFEAKVAAGAEFAIAQPLFDRVSIESSLRYAEQFGIPVIASVLPLTSAAHAEYVRNELQIPIPDAIMRRLGDAGDHALDTGIEIAREQVAYLRGLAAGVRVIASGIDTAAALRIATGKG